MPTSTFTITKIDLEKGHVSVIYSVDGVEQTMCDAPLTSEKELKAFLDEYGARYEASLASDKGADPAPVEEVKLQSLIGKTIEIGSVETPNV
jgi:hypothetical protein